MADGHQIRKVNFPAVFHPTDPNVLFVGARGGLRKSVDRGKTYKTVAGTCDPANPDMPNAAATSTVSRAASISRARARGSGCVKSG